MKIPTSTSQRRGGALEIQMTPMIDMVFLLIIFFVWTSGGQVVERLLPSRLAPQAGVSASSTIAEPPPPEADFDPLVIRLVIREGRFVRELNSQAVASIAELHTLLKRTAAIQAAAPVVVHPDAEIPLSEVIAAYDAARRAGFEKIQFAAAGEERPS